MAKKTKSIYKNRTFLVSLGCAVLAIAIILLTSPTSKIRPESAINPNLKNSEVSSSTISDSGRITRNKSKLRVESISQKFEDIPISKQRENVLSRISNLRRDLQGSENPSRIIEHLFQNIGSMNPSQRQLYSGLVESEIASIDPNDESKLEWFVNILPEIKDALSANKLYCGRSSLSDIFSKISFNLFNLHANVMDEIRKIPVGPEKDALLVGLLPQNMINLEENYEDVVYSVPENLRPQFEQYVITESAITEPLRIQAIDLYLQEKGEAGLQQDVVSRWFISNSWLDDHADQLKEVLIDSKESERKSIIFAEIRKRVSNTRNFEKWSEFLDGVR